MASSRRKMSTFNAKLQAACQANRSLLCVGLDPDPRRMPVADVFEFNRTIIDATSDLVCAYKPNLAFYEALGLGGLEALQKTVDHIRRRSPGVPIIGDAKRGDVGSTAEAYAKALFESWGFDATTVNAYGGRDTVEPFLSYRGNGVFIWCRSSNPGAGDLQDLREVEGGTVYEAMATKAKGWSSSGNLGLVVGATYPQELSKLRELCPDMIFLVPGVGAQGGDLEAAVLAGVDREGRRAIINSSRQVLYASNGPDYAQAARLQATRLREAINGALEQGGMGWS